MRNHVQMALLTIVAVAGLAPVAFGQGIYAPTAGPINTGMAGASVAAPVDFGSSYWNPANISGLQNQEVLISSSLSFPSIHFENATQAGAVNGMFPPQNRFGTVRSDSGVPAGIATGVSFRLKDESPITFGLGVFGLVGGNVNFPGNVGVPVVSPRQPPNFFGVGPIYANLALLGVNPMASMRLSDRLSIGGGPVITSGTASFSPAFFAPGPKDATGLPTFPAATNARPFWGAGFQLGLLYELNDAWNLGFSYKSPIWQERWDFNATYPNLAPRRIGLQATIPEVLSWGVAYKAIPKTILDVDLRYFDYANTALFGQSVTDGGLAWRSVFAVAFGARYQATDRLSLMSGYLYNTNPIRSTATLFNVQAPGFITNVFTLGTSLRLNDNITFSLAWFHGFRNSIQGPILQIPGTSTRLDAQIDSINAGFNITFGGKKHRPEHAPGPDGSVVTVGPREA